MLFILKKKKKNLFHFHDTFKLWVVGRIISDDFIREDNFTCHKECHEACENSYLTSSVAFKGAF